MGDRELDRAERAEEALARRDELYALVIHDLRNPLNTISMSCALLADDVGDGAKETLARIRRAVDRMEKLMRDVTELTRYEHGQVKLDIVALAAADLQRHAFEPYTAKAAAKNLTLESSSADQALRVLVDRERFLQALGAMIDNAVRLTPDNGRVTLSVRERDGHVDFVVTDAGPGLADEDKATVFERHRRINKKRGQGIALGLAIASLIAELHGGSVGVDSELGKGASFWLRVPRA